VVVFDFGNLIDVRNHTLFVYLLLFTEQKTIVFMVEIVDTKVSSSRSDCML
jgi:hypothetical protein